MKNILSLNTNTRAEFSSRHKTNNVRESKDIAQALQSKGYEKSLKVSKAGSASEDGGGVRDPISTCLLNLTRYLPNYYEHEISLRYKNLYLGPYKQKIPGSLEVKGGKP